MVGVDLAKAEKAVVHVLLDASSELRALSPEQLRVLEEAAGRLAAEVQEVALRLRFRDAQAFDGLRDWLRSLAQEYAREQAELAARNRQKGPAKRGKKGKERRW